MHDPVTIAVIAPVQPEDHFDLLWQGVWEATLDLGEFGVVVRNLPTDGREVAEQRKILEALLERGVDAIAIFPVHVDALDDILDRHDRQGTAVVTFRADAPESKRAAFVGADSVQAGRIAAEVLVKMMRGNGRVVTFAGAPEDFRFGRRHQSLREEFRRYQGRIVEESWSGQILDPAPELAAVLRSADGIYVGNEDLVQIASLLEELQVSVPCVGFANAELLRPFLERGTVSAVIDENRYQQGYFAVQKAYEAILKRVEGTPLSGVQIPSTVAFAASAREGSEWLSTAFERLVRQRTEMLCSYKDRLEQANREILNLSMTDPLTGLLNRRKFEQVIEQEVARALRYKPVSLLLTDLNNFKSINDRCGHSAGDEVLKAVAGVLTSCCRGTDLCARLDGDKFAVILPFADAAAAAVVTDRVLKTMAAQRVRVGNRVLTLSLSIGAATVPEDAYNVETLIHAADSARQRFKEAWMLRQAGDAVEMMNQ